uniref:CW-type domain-containing protein n=1 Tax=Heligmosomoides polygyrus TaxID=6339 RepID=A0A183FYF4_HELPZ
LEKFHIENRKLPKSLRRSEPKRPEVVLDENGKVDIEATNEVRWDNAQSLLIPCENCGRRFGVSPLFPRNSTPACWRI